MALSRGPSVPTTTDGDWTVQAADTIERLVGSVRDKTTVPLTTVARGVVYGLLAAVLGLTALVLLAIAVVRILDNFVPGDVWIAHGITGTVFTLLGLLAWSRRRPK